MWKVSWRNQGLKRDQPLTQSSLEKERELKRDGTGMKQLKRNWFLRKRPSLTSHRPRSLPQDQISKHLTRKKLFLTSPEKLTQTRKLSTRQQQRKNRQQTKKKKPKVTNLGKQEARLKKSRQNNLLKLRAEKLAAQFFKAVSPSENLDNFTNEDNGHED